MYKVNCEAHQGTVYKPKDFWNKTRMKTFPPVRTVQQWLHLKDYVCISLPNPLGFFIGSPLKLLTFLWGDMAFSEAQRD